MNKVVQKIIFIIHMMVCRKYIIAGTKIHDVIRKYTSNKYVSDRDFKTMDITQFEKMLNYSPIRYIPYTKEIFDCDDYSFALMGLMKLFIPDIAFGIIWTNTHAFNFFIDNNHKLWFVEPQNNKIVDSIDDPIQIMMI